ncbi:MAG: hypothetical protein M1816_000690 [Peltula sp. TS41687]|nr:MAG: hypothetical protein M1816_000690 [Peltula sp. TS41687]
MSVGIFGPPVGFSSLQQTPRFSSMQLEPVNRSRKIEFATEIGPIRLHYRTIRKYLPGLWRLISSGELHYHPRHDVIDAGLEFGLVQPVHQTCITYLFQHLQEMERTGVNSMRLTEWLEGLYKGSLLHEVNYVRPHPNLSKLTKTFEGLGKVLSSRKFQSHRTLFELMLGFFTRYCRDLYKQLYIEDFLKYIFALDRMHHDMRSVLAMTLQAIGSKGRRQLVRRKDYGDSNYRRLRLTTRMAIERIYQAKKHRHPLIPFRTNPGIHGQMVRMRNPTDWQPVLRSQIPHLQRRFGPQGVEFHQHHEPGNHVLYRVTGSPARLGNHYGHPHVSGISGYYPPYSPELMPSDGDFSDDDDSYSILSHPEDYYEVGHHPEITDYRGYTPRRLSFGGVDEDLLHGIQEQPWDMLRYDTELFDNGIYGSVHDDLFERRRTF